MSNIELALFSFVCGWMCSLTLKGITVQMKKYQEMKEKIAEYKRKENSCPHGHENWDNCPDCCH